MLRPVSEVSGQQAQRISDAFAESGDEADGCGRCAGQAEVCAYYAGGAFMGLKIISD